MKFAGFSNFISRHGIPSLAKSPKVFTHAYQNAVLWFVGRILRGIRKQMIKTAPDCLALEFDHELLLIAINLAIVIN